MLQFTRCIGILCCGLLCTVCTAETLCVANGDELQAALIQAGSNAEADEIRLTIGLYTNAQPEPFVLDVTDGEDIQITGGWYINPCSKQANAPQLTRISGEFAHKVMNIFLNNGGALRIANLSFIDSLEPGDSPAGLNISSTFTHQDTILIERTRFTGHVSTKWPALRIYQGGTVILRNNLFQDNLTLFGWGIALMQSGENSDYYLLNNTLIHNSHDDASGTPLSGLSISLSHDTHLYLANNLFWNNAGAVDVKLERTANHTGQVHAHNNNIHALLGTVDFASKNQYIDPMLDGHTPHPNSPMRDAGQNPPPPGTPPLTFADARNLGQFDLHGHPRIAFAQVDIGAVEYYQEVIFRDGLE